MRAILVSNSSANRLKEVEYAAKLPVSVVGPGTIGLLALAACGRSEPKAIAPASAAELAADAAAGYISSSNAGEHIGEVRTVKGSVTEYSYKTGAKGKPYIFIFDTFVARADVRGTGMGLEIPPSFKVIIWKDDQMNFPSNFAAGYEGHSVCATGTIMDYNGDPAIEAHDPSQLKPTFPIWVNIPLSKSSAFFKPLSICETLAVGMAIITP